MIRSRRHEPNNRKEFVPLESLRADEAAAPQVDDALLKTLSTSLSRFAEKLSEDEQAALSVLLSTVAPPMSAAAELAAEPPEAVLTPQEIIEFNRLKSEPQPLGRGLRSTLIMVMKATRNCNLRCTYCHSWSDEPNQRMSFEVLARATRGALAAPGVQTVEFVWHGGEPTLLPLSFYRKAFWLQQQFRRPGQEIANAVQTNGTAFGAEWVAFCRRYRVSVGISLDGPPEIHDRRRIDAAGRATSSRVHEALHEVKAAGLRHGVLMVVDDEVIALGAKRLLHYFLELEVENVALLNVTAENKRGDIGAAADYVDWPQFVNFLRELYHLWWPEYAKRISFREISDLVARVNGDLGCLCVFNGNCMGGFLTVEPNGAVSACDKYLGDPSYNFGNVMAGELADLPMASSLRHAATITEEGIAQAHDCPWFDICHGGCPHDRYLRAERLVPHDESCCGLAPLLADIAHSAGKGRKLRHRPKEKRFFGRTQKGDCDDNRKNRTRVQAQSEN